MHSNDPKWKTAAVRWSKDIEEKADEYRQLRREFMDNCFRAKKAAQAAEKLAEKKMVSFPGTSQKVMLDAATRADKFMDSSLEAFEVGGEVAMKILTGYYKG